MVDAAENDQKKSKAELIRELRSLRAQVASLEQAATKPNRNQLLHDMGERIKELRCMYGVARSIRVRDTLEEVFRDVAGLIPPGWHYPEVTRGRVRFGGKCYDSQPFDPTPWKLSSDILIHGAQRGTVEVYYMTQQPPANEGPFLTEERHLIDGIADALGEAIERKEAVVALRAREHELRERVKELSCLYGIAELVEEPGATLEEIFQGTAELMPRSWQHVDVACARVVVEGRSFETANFELSQWCQTRDIVVRGEKLGQVDLCYLQPRPQADEGPFLTEEAHLLTAIADRLARVIERARGEQERLELQRQLHHAQKLEAVGQLAGGITHDVNNFATVVLGYVAFVRGMLPQDHEAIDLLDGIEDAAEQAASITRSLLTFSRKVPTSKEPIDLRVQIGRSLRLLQRVMPASIDVVADIDQEIPVWVDADETHIQQVIMNLAINARDAMPDGGTLTVAVCPTDEQTQGHDTPDRVAKLVVKDTGAGISSDMQTRIFEPFFSTKPRGQGTGLGLAIIHGIVKDHGGEIELHSQPGQGATFTVTLPLMDAPVENSERGTATKTRAGRGGRVLLAEDSRHVRRIITSALAALDYEVIQVGDGLSLLQRFHEHAQHLQLLVFDVDLPGRSGLKRLREIRAAGFRIPAIVITADATTDVEGGLDPDSVLLRKPFQITDFSDLVEQLLGTPSEQET